MCNACKREHHEMVAALKKAERDVERWGQGIHFPDYEFTPPQGYIRDGSSYPGDPLEGELFHHHTLGLRRWTGSAWVDCWPKEGYGWTLDFDGGDVTCV